MVYVKKCVLCKARNSDNITLFSFLSNKREEWAEFCLIPSELLPSKALLCSQHFSLHQFKNSTAVGTGKRLTLKKDAIPTIRSTTETVSMEQIGMHDTENNISNNESKMNEKVVLRKKYCRCCVCGCVPIDEAKKISSFRFPKCETYRNIWLESLQLTEFKEWYRICERHFVEGNVENVPTRDLVYGKYGSVSMQNNPKKQSDNITVIDSSVRSAEEGNPNTAEITTSSPLVDAHSITEDCNLSCNDLEENDNNSIAKYNESDMNATKNTEMSTPTNTGQKRYYRYFCEFNTPDLETPKRKRRCLELGRSQITQYQQKIAVLSHQNQRLRKKVISLQEALDNLRKKDLLSEASAEAIMIE